MKNKLTIIADLSYPIKSGMPTFPGDGELSLCRQHEYSLDKYRLSSLYTPLHAGTHIDMPSHLTADKRMVLDFNPAAFAATAVYIDCSNTQEIIYRSEYRDMIKPGDALLIRTDFADLYAEPERYYNDFPVITEEFADFICESGISILGLDTPSPDHEPYTLHKKLLEHGIFIVENLTNLKTLTELPPRSFTFMALPLKLDAEASPVRAVAVK
jgi:Predicted metal-dependent hydrolase